MDKNSNIITIIKKHPKTTIGIIGSAGAIGAGLLAKPIFDILTYPVTIINELQKKSLLKQQLEELKAIKNLSNNKNDISKLPLQQKLIINPMS
jgi:GrpB-like predicted nucleotidyltransferase (UPF0157 family)